MNTAIIERSDAAEARMLVSWIGLLFDTGARVSEQDNVLIGDDEYSKEDLVKIFDSSVKFDKQNDLVEKVAACLGRYKEKNNPTIEREREELRTELRSFLFPLTVSEWLEQNNLSQYCDALLALPGGIVDEKSAKSLMGVTGEQLTAIGMTSTEERRLWYELLAKYFGNNKEEKEEEVITSEKFINNITTIIDNYIKNLNTDNKYDEKIITKSNKFIKYINKYIEKKNKELDNKQEEDLKSWIGCNCQVWITDDEDWKPGKVTKYVAESGKHTITYDDDKSTEEIEIKQRIEDEHFEWISFSWSKEFLTILKDDE